MIRAGTVLCAGLAACVTADDSAIDPPASASDATAGAIVFTPGVFSLTGTDKPPAPEVYDNPDVAGIAVRASWAGLQSGPGDYHWDYIEDQIANAAAAGKQVSIYLAAGLPDWVRDLGVETFTYLDPNPNHGTFGDEITIAVPYDHTYQTRWTTFVRAFGAHFAGDPTIAYVRGASESMTNGWGLPIEDVDGNTWAAYGYTPEKMIAALELVLDTFMTALPGTAEWIEVGPIKFEPELSGNPEVYVADAVTTYGFATYPGRFAVWREDLSGCTEAPPTSAVWQLLWDHPGRDGAQMLWNVQDGPDRMNKCGITPNDRPTVLKAAIQRGLDYGMPYLEIYETDVKDDSLRAVLRFAHTRLGT
jgi:hypothetical protein